ncbi:MAG: hypothetical protein H0U57_03910 [Tatlockia sp.]|nr:hypothetical protein [Tatlockia sp.]
MKKIGKSAFSLLVLTGVSTFLTGCGTLKASAPSDHHKGYGGQGGHGGGHGGR